MRIKRHSADLCVVGGGLAGLCAAVAAAREGIRVVLMHERPVLGGNASSEIRMWIYGAKGSNNRETGILEEINLESLYRNPLKNYSIWDSILYEKVRFEPNIELLLNCSCCDATMDGQRIKSIKGWQMTTQTWHEVEAPLFADCSGDSILAPLSGAEYRFGREASGEFGERTLTDVEDRKTMGNNCLIQLRKDSKPSTFIPPFWAKKITKEALKDRKHDLNSSRENFWFLELGGEQDVIYDAEKIKDECLALSMGMFDYIKNSGEYDDAELWQLEFLSFLPGKRESRRYVGDYMMTEVDIRTNRSFDDAVCYGGWPCDDHQPLGFWCDGPIARLLDTPEIYQIPYRVLYSRNIDNLFFAGRNISMTHEAMSSARVMGTCALLGQAVGTAAAIAAQKNLSPRGVNEKHIELLQQKLLYRDVFIPRIQRIVPELSVKAKLISPDESINLENLRNGRDRNNSLYDWVESGVFIPLGQPVEYRFDTPQRIKAARIVFDSDLDRDTLPGDEWTRKYVTRCNILPTAPPLRLPTTLVKSFSIECADENGIFHEIFSERMNTKRLVLVPVDRNTTALRLIIHNTHDLEGKTKAAHVFSFEVYQDGI
jgi:hypothetical protein